MGQVCPTLPHVQVKVSRGRSHAAHIPVARFPICTLPLRLPGLDVVSDSFYSGFRYQHTVRVQPRDANSICGWLMGLDSVVEDS